jgi:hypothetical protein
MAEDSYAVAGKWFAKNGGPCELQLEPLPFDPAVDEQVQRSTGGNASTNAVTTQTHTSVAQTESNGSRPRLPIAGTGAAAWRQPASKGSKAQTPLSPAAKSSPSRAAGAIASDHLKTRTYFGSLGAQLANAADVSNAPMKDGDGSQQVAQEVSSWSSLIAQRANVKSWCNNADTRRQSSPQEQPSIQIAALTREIERLRAEVAFLRQSDAAGRSESPSSPRSGTAWCCACRCAREKLHAALASEARATEERDRAMHQISEMTKFLADYGLTWVGDRNSSIEENCEQVMTMVPEPSQLRQIDIGHLSSKAEELNLSVEKTGARIVSDRVGGVTRARFVVDEMLPLPLTVFKDGLKLGAEEFLPLNSMGADRLLEDIFDGYFPYALKEKYPEGVALRVVDRVVYTYSEWLRDRAQRDAELADGGDRLVPPGGQILQRPSGAANTTGVDPQACAAADLLAISLLNEGRDPDASTVRLQIKLLCGHRVVLHAEATTTIGQVEECLQRRHGDCCEASDESTALGANNNKVLRTAFPPRSYTERSDTLAVAGLMPSATLFVGSCDSSAN